MDSVGDHFDRLQKQVAGFEQFVHRQSGIPFVLTPEGTFLMGLSTQEQRDAHAITSALQANVEEMRPVRRRAVPRLLVSITPILNNQRLPSQLTSDARAAYFERDAAVDFAASLNCRLPREFEWEYLCRAGTATLFPFGDALPSDPELERWLSSDFSQLKHLSSNGFGLFGMSNPEWCDEKFTTNLSADAAIYDGSYTIRGGGAYFWPWQDEEWVWCMSAMRSPSSGLEDGKACLRLVYDVER